jgi:hypothetical protein
LVKLSKSQIDKFMDTEIEAEFKKVFYEQQKKNTRSRLPEIQIQNN